MKIKILIVSMISVILFNGCGRHGEVTPADVITAGVVGAFLIAPLSYWSGHNRHHHYRHHRHYRHHYRR